MFKLKKIFLFLLLTCCLVSFAASKIPNDSWQIRANALGPIKVGMTIEEAEQVAHKKIISEPLTAGMTEACRYANFADEPKNVLLMLNNNHIVRIEIKNSTFETDKGIAVGSGVKQVLANYHNQIIIEPDKYNAEKGWQNLIFTPSNDKQHQIIFDTDGKKIINIRLGKLPEVAFVEGCY